MKLAEIDSSFETNNVKSVSRFRIADTSHMYKMLSDGLYANRLRWVTEMLVNAWDAMRATGNVGEVPVDLQLPSKEDPSFILRDYGPGIPADLMTDIYCTVGASLNQTFTETSGGYGLGCKSPLSYADSFAVTVFDGQNRRDYSIGWDEHRVPVCVLLAETPTEEPSGLKFSIAVKPDDIAAVRREAFQTIQRSRHPYSVAPAVPNLTTAGLLNESGDDIASQLTWPVYTRITDSVYLVDKDPDREGTNTVPRECIFSYPYRSPVRTLSVYLAGYVYTLNCHSLTPAIEEISSELRDPEVLKGVEYLRLCVGSDLELAVCVPFADQGKAPVVLPTANREHLQETPEMRMWLAKELVTAGKCLIDQFVAEINEKKSPLEFWRWVYTSQSFSLSAESSSFEFLRIAVNKSKYSSEADGFCVLGKRLSRSRSSERLVQEIKPLTRLRDAVCPTNHGVGFEVVHITQTKHTLNMAVVKKLVQEPQVVLVDQPSQWRKRIQMVSDSRAPLKVAIRASFSEALTAEQWDAVERWLQAYGFSTVRVSSLPSPPRKSRSTEPKVKLKPQSIPLLSSLFFDDNPSSRWSPMREDRVNSAVRSDEVKVVVVPVTGYDACWGDRLTFSSSCYSTFRDFKAYAEYFEELVGDKKEVLFAGVRPTEYRVWPDLPETCVSVDVYLRDLLDKVQPYYFNYSWRTQVQRLGLRFYANCGREVVAKVKEGLGRSSQKLSRLQQFMDAFCDLSGGLPPQRANAMRALESLIFHVSTRRTSSRVDSRGRHRVGVPEVCQAFVEHREHYTKQHREAIRDIYTKLSRQFPVLCWSSNVWEVPRDAEVLVSYLCHDMRTKKYCGLSPKDVPRPTCIAMPELFEVS